jgi:uncharacterized protein (TIGR00661 family)
MANILYGVNGEGSGHSTRAKEVITHLQQRGHRVHVVSFDRGLRNLSEHFDVTEIYGLRLTYVNNRVRYGRTVARNLFRTPRFVASQHRLEDLACRWRTELVITDFEPLSCRVGRRLGLPIISVDNQHWLTNTRVRSPRRFARDAAAAKLVTRLMTPHADAYLVTALSTAEIKPRHRPNTFVFSPILRREVLDAQPVRGKHLLVYVTSPSPQLARRLQQLDQRAICYGFGTRNLKPSKNLTFKPPSASEFLRDLAACKAVIANAGFSLVSEALHLGKPYFAIPVRHQFEQYFNAYSIEQMGYGVCCDKPALQPLADFLGRLPRFEQELACYPRAGNAALLAKLDNLIARFTWRT